MAARGWFRRAKGRLVYVWQVKDPATGKAKERAKVIADAALSDEEGWQIVGKLKAEGTIKTDHEPSPDRFFSEIASFYLANKAWKKESTKVLHTQIVNKILVPRWGAQVAVKIKPVEVKAWLRSLDLEEATTYKYKTVMGTVFRFGQAEGLLPLGEAYNPISYVTGIPATSDYEAIELTPEQALRVLDQLQQPEYTMIVLVAVTGIRSGEMLGAPLARHPVGSFRNEDQADFRARQNPRGCENEVVEVDRRPSSNPRTIAQGLACRNRIRWRR